LPYRHSSWKDNFWSIKPNFTSMQYITMTSLGGIEWFAQMYYYTELLMRI
jgi:hypothetical protein